MADPCWALSIIATMGSSVVDGGEPERLRDRSQTAVTTANV